KLLLLRHEDGWVTAYAHNSELLVKVGDTVRRGQTVARAGSTGNVGRPQVHFEMRRGRVAVDPLRYLAARSTAEAGGKASLSRSALRDDRPGPG
ncbi:MAG TPA: M23 family metallopeptidase, partial [Alphaproteobacteria bacterium]|nr:M23 family metallopeptidase [Alphaproteobacteria bacterium]